MKDVMSFYVQPDNREDETVIETEQEALEMEPHYQELIRMSQAQKVKYLPQQQACNEPLSAPIDTFINMNDKH